MAQENQSSYQAAPGPDWSAARPDVVSEPTVWPAATGLGVTLCLWGLASSFIITGVGVCLFALSLGGWIQDIRHERKRTIP